MPVYLNPKVWNPMKPLPINIKNVREMHRLAMQAAQERTEPIDITDEELSVLEGIADDLHRVAVLTNGEKVITIAHDVYVMPECKEWLLKRYGVDDTWSVRIERR